MLLSLWGWFWGYIKVSCWKILWILFCAAVFLLLYRVLQKKGYMTFKKEIKKSILCEIMLALSCSLIFVMTLFGRVSADYGFDIKPFASYYKVFSENNIELLLQIIMNIAMYLPLGFLLPCCFKVFEKGRYTILAALICSACIEIIQGFAKIGLFEIDDILNNTLGAIIGVLLYKLDTKVKEKWNHRQAK